VERQQKRLSPLAGASTGVPDSRRYDGLAWKKVEKVQYKTASKNLDGDEKEKTLTPGKRGPGEDMGWFFHDFWSALA
jgi:hypothetical protein